MALVGKMVKLGELVHFDWTSNTNLKFLMNWCQPGQLHYSQSAWLLRKLYILIARWDPEPPLDARCSHCVSCGDYSKSQQRCAWRSSYHIHQWWQKTWYSFVKLCNSHLHEYYLGEGVSITTRSKIMVVLHSSNVSDHLLLLLVTKLKTTANQSSIVSVA